LRTALTQGSGGDARPLLLSWRRRVLLAGAFALPLAYAPVAYDAFVIPKLALARLIVLTLLGLQVAEWIWNRGVRIRRTPLDVPLLAFVCSAGLSTLLAVNHNVALFGTYTRFDGLLTIATYALLFWLTVHSLTGAGDARALMRSLLAGCAVAAVIGILQTVIATATASGHPGETALSFGGVFRPTATLGNANEFGILLAMVLPLAVYETIAARTWATRVIGGSATLVFLLAITLSLSRSAWLGASAGTLLVVTRSLQRRWRIAMIIALALGVLTVAGVTASRAGSSSSIVSAVVSRLATLGDPTGGSAASRLHIWSDTARVIAARPLAGWGPDSFGLVYPRYQSGNWTPGTTIDEAHSEVLQVAATQGLIGVGCYLWLLVALFQSFMRGRAADGAVALAGGVLAYQLALQFNFTWIPSAAPYWLLVAAAVVKWTPQPREAAAPRRARTNSGLTIAATGVALAGVAGAVIAGTLPLAADAAFLGALDAQHRGAIPLARSLIGDARARAPQESAYAVRAGDLALDLRFGDVPGPDADWRAAIAAYTEAARLGTPQATAYRHLAVAYRALNRRSAAIAAARTAVALGPYDGINAELLRALLATS